ncbi:DNA-binding transcriptional regulator, LysR family [Oscillibacter sp. PC13]|uniref:LysR family transcriptional regulator n=1 Tax=Oscillibacter sp. PC13 TaxID=1855299 RepID=UPI0008E49F58|nr:LysR family transcriptional regulator [Oscillibacter sp. PC13]SFP91234.1 DNA-binding transcriptional regulator, LysR family [Oscillibacter sp. PC13]
MISSLFYKLFVEIADTGNISRAAEKLAYSQSGLSHTINRAEEELGFKLFRRTKNGVVLTEESKVLLPLARQIVSSINMMDETISSIQKLNKGHIKIGTYASVSMHFLPELLKSFTRNYPGITIEIIEGSKAELQRLLVGNLINIAFTSLTPGDSFEQIPLFDDPIVAVFPKDMQLDLDDQGRFAVQNLAQYDFIMPIMDHVIDVDIEPVIDQNNLEFSSYMSSLDYVSIMYMIRSGLGVSLLPELMTFHFMDYLTIQHITPQSYRTIGMEINSSKDASLAISEFIQYVKSYTIDSFIPNHEQYGFVLKCEPEREKKRAGYKLQNSSKPSIQ